jgi:hypothetical protein
MDEGALVEAVLRVAEGRIAAPSEPGPTSPFEPQAAPQAQGPQPGPGGLILPR